MTMKKEEKEYLDSLTPDTAGFMQGIEDEGVKRYIRLKDQEEHHLVFSDDAPRMASGKYGAQIEYLVFEDHELKYLTMSSYFFERFRQFLTSNKLLISQLDGKIVTMQRLGKRDRTRYIFKLQTTLPKQTADKPPKTKLSDGFKNE